MLSEAGKSVSGKSSLPEGNMLLYEVKELRNPRVNPRKVSRAERIPPGSDAHQHVLLTPADDRTPAVSPTCICPPAAAVAQILSVGIPGLEKVPRIPIRSDWKVMSTNVFVFDNMRT